MFEYEIRTDSIITTVNNDEMATTSEIRKMHDWPETDPGRIPDDEVITVVVMDTGIHRGVAQNHPWFENAELTKEFDVTESDDTGDAVGHGTGVASLIAKNTPRVELYSVRIFGESGVSSGFREIQQAYQWMIDRKDEIDIVNMSWGTRTDVPHLNRLHERLINAGIHDVVSAGNSGTDGGSPATSTKAYSVGAIDENGAPTRFSSFDPDVGNPDIAAIGKNVRMARATKESTMGTPLNNSFVKASGTSFSAPITTAAYINALYEKKLSWDNRFMRSAIDIDGTPKDGAGILKYKKTIEESKESGQSEEGNPKVDGHSWNFKGNDTLWIEKDWLPSGETTVELIDETKNYIDIRIKK